jgi:hypothetical protein
VLRAWRRSLRAGGLSGLERAAVWQPGLVFAVALAAGAWASSFMTFPGQDVAYTVDAARNLVEGRGLTTNVIWTYTTGPLSFPRPAFELWLPMPALLAAVPMVVLGTDLRAAQVSSILLAGCCAVLTWRLAADAATAMGLGERRARAIALASGLLVAVDLPIVLGAAQPDSTLPFAALVLAATIVMGRLLAGVVAPSTSVLVGLGLLIGMAAWTRNEAIWLALTWAIVAVRLGRNTSLVRLVGVPALVAIAVFTPWAIRDWLAFGNPLPSQVLDNALSLDGRDVFAWQDRPSLELYLAAGPATLLGLRWTAFLHDLGTVLLVLGAPASVIGLVGLPSAIRRTAVLQPLAIFGAITFAVTTLIFPVVTLAGTFLHGAGAIHVLLAIGAVFAIDAVMAAMAARRGWIVATGRAAALATIGAAAANATVTAGVIPTQAAMAATNSAVFAALPRALAGAGAPLPSNGSPIISDVPNWVAERLRQRAIALPDERPASVLDLARSFDAPLLLVSKSNQGIWPEVLQTGEPAAACFQSIDLGRDPVLGDIAAYRISCL